MNAIRQSVSFFAGAMVGAAIISSAMAYGLVPYWNKTQVKPVVVVTYDYVAGFRLPDDLVKSFEVDLIAAKHADRTEMLNVIGMYSPFHGSFGYYADPVDHKTATLPKGWKGRLVNLPAGDTEGVLGLCLDPHDLAIAKYVARREKDIIFN